ncbi:uncharacterized protein LAESUDRAFT_474009 [Laetiporus sulphureus 93-53]|uniref:Uncharacterized protein n=1 Tax=Laetiporus sulphureus 93-53 TaxID=1314785 RepID=A0A165CMP0_9APHY|nr:uncharacterized protein LAESUDRAFT_384470 [Laetiporus sulphureus 93-53]XP_040767886.1 uncharacterized protein LAESUDRAFT_474009 [Laetiporus sulphureus 93-53]KZT03090.1 hypothetical protein LAESUDRAFT_384470 [Laetiporus sulphureus 93-53]KZT10146.1 hypothetical protein LAESUDRAFT_474009 [Laetiporus sulphureus 93-53]
MRPPSEISRCQRGTSLASGLPMHGAIPDAAPAGYINASSRCHPRLNLRTAVRSRSRVGIDGAQAYCGGRGHRGRAVSKAGWVYVTHFLRTAHDRRDDLKHLWHCKLQ